MRSLHDSFTPAVSAPACLGALAALLLLAGCAPRTRPGVVPAPGASPVEPAPAAESAVDASGDARLLADIRADLEARRTAVQSLRGRAEILVSAPEIGGATRVESAVLARRPSHLRVRGWVGPVTVFDAATDPERAALYVPEKERVWRASIRRLEQESGLPLAPRDLVSALLGEPFGELDSLRLVEAGPDAAVVSWSLGADRRVEARYLRDRLVPAEFRLMEGKEGVATLHYSDYRKESVGWWPRALSFSWPRKKARLELRFRDLELNPDLPPEAFEIRAPQGTSEIEVGGSTRIGGQRPGGNP